MISFSYILHRSSKTLTISTSLSSFFTTLLNPDKPLPRKGKQATRRILKLLSSQPSKTQNPDIFEALNSLQNSPQTLSSSQASTLITAVSNPLISFDFYRFLRSSKPIFKPDSILFSSLIKSQLQSINPRLFKIRYFFEEMKKNKISLSNDEFCSLFGSVLPNCVEIAGFFIHEVLEDIEFDVGTYSFAISVYAKHGLFKEAILVAERMRAKCGKPSLEFYSSLMDVYEKNVDARAAMKLFLEMEERGIIADEGIYRVLLGILCRVGSMRLCCAILEEMKRAGYRPDETLAMDLMRRFVKEDMFSEAKYFFKGRILKDKESLALFVQALTEKRKPWIAIELIRDLQKSGLDIDGYVYALLIRGCGKMGLIDDAEKIFAEIKSAVHIKNRELVYSSMIYVYSRAETRTLAETVWHEMEATKCFRESGETFLYMMSMYGALGLDGDVVRMFERWKNSCCSIGIDAYVVLMDSLSKSGKLNQARVYLIEMRRLGIHPKSSIYLSMMEGYVRVGLINHAIALFDEYTMLGLEVDEVVASTVLRILIQAGRLSELEVYLDKFMRQRIKISEEKGAVLIEICRDDSCLRKLSRLIK